MSLIIIGKMGIVSVGIAAASWGCIALTRWLTTADVEIYGFVYEGTMLESPAPENKDQLKCRIKQDKEEEFACNIQEVTKFNNEPNNTKKITFLNEFAQASDSLSTTNITELNANKLYKIIISSTDFSGKASDWKTKPIEVLKGSKTLGSITSLFAIKPDQSTVLGLSTKHFVGQASDNLATTDIYKCHWEENKTTDLKDCEVFVIDSSASPQANNKLSSLTFTETAVTKDIKKHHHYLIKFKEDFSAEDLSQFTKSTIVHAKDSTDSVSKKATFKSLFSAVNAGDELLILSPATEA